MYVQMFYAYSKPAERSWITSMRKTIKLKLKRLELAMLLFASVQHYTVLLDLR